MTGRTMYDVAVIGAGPAGAQAAVSAAHQMRHVLVLDAGPVSQRKGRAFWSKSVDILDAPVFPRTSGPKFVRALHEWLAAQPVRSVTIAGRRRTVGIERRAGVVLRVRRVEGHLWRDAGERAPSRPAVHEYPGPGAVFELELSSAPLHPDTPLQLERVFARTVVAASGFEDVWPDIEVDDGAKRLYQRHRVLFRYAGNRKGWHVCIRCDGHLHVDEHLAILATGDLAWDIARGAQDFTDKVTILTNGRPHGFTAQQLETLQRRGVPIVQERIVAHIGKRSDLLGLRLADGREVFFDGYFLDEGLTPNTEYLRAADGWSPQRDADGLLVVDEDGRVLDRDGVPLPGLFAAGDIVAGQRKLIATAFGLGQNAGLAASDHLREW